MAQITDAAFIARGSLVLGTLQFLPATGILFATALLLGKLDVLLVALSFERADTTPCHDQCLFGIRGHSGKMNFSQVNSGLYVSWRMLHTWYLNTHMQFKATVPDQGTCSCFFWQVKRQNQRLVPFAHR
jgi:hypothetical protein